ncbi:phosphatidate cytidylyltransferase [Flavicella marina]|uniref:phosphatidate cytidylyltransferase n=1 Tax=Flavicella marina TaxID=1475951 RepID=UPI0012657255|nr:phosphatidate cytidylyltransferase [Flavicella marina]
MNNMLTRAISGAIFVSILVFSILFSHQTFIGLFFILMLASLYEFSKMLRLPFSEVYLVGIFAFITSATPFLNISSDFTTEITILAILAVFIKNLFRQNSNSINSIGTFLLCIAYACFGYIFIIKIPFTNALGTYQGSLILAVFILIWVSDTFAYITGVSIGKTKLLERISPKKTIEGFAGGVIATLVAAYIIALYNNILTPIQWIGLGAIVSIFGVLGDLIASMFKRETGIKDTGKIIPGHGGIIDRLDSIIFAAPFIYFYLKFITEHVS